MGTITPSMGSCRTSIIRNDLFSLESIPGKGKGLIATQDIPPGTCIISEPPLFTTADIKTNDVEKEVKRILQALPKDDIRAFFSLHNNNPGRDPFTNIIRSNGYPLGPSSDIGGIFLNIARINHSCLANTQQSWNTVRGQETAYAMRKIEAGQEISIAYKIGGPSQKRKFELKELFGFDCYCELCGLSADQLSASDENYRQMDELDEKIGSPKRVRMMPDRVLAECHTLLGLYRRERVVDTRISRLYHDAFQICVMHSDKARAKVFAKRCAEAMILCEGEDSDNVTEMLRLADNPTGHKSYGATLKWKSDIRSVPQELPHEEFEKWLWKAE